MRKVQRKQPKEGLILASGLRNQPVVAKKAWPWDLLSFGEIKKERTGNREGLENTKKKKLMIFTGENNYEKLSL